MLRVLCSLSAALLLGGGAALAQQNVGIAVGGVLSTSVAVPCGFDCSSASNTYRASGLVGASVDVRVFGDAGLPAAVAIGSGTALSFCPGIVIPGIQNSLLILPPNFLVAVGVPALAPGNRICTTTGVATAIRGLVLLPVASGATLTFQALVFDNGVPTFTRPVEVAVR
ncbi:MAG: hypothetical protein IPM29_03600 [Planctomycetes bacterium]|nr:hypothetical protein [Planctomycetota bacterium]